MAAGDHIRVRRFLYCHHGIDLGDGTVVHLSGEPKRKRNATVRRDPMDEFRCGTTAEVVPHAGSLPPEAVVRRALSRLGDSGYSLLFHNCEHFACWCSGVPDRDTQVDRTARCAAAIGVGMRIAAALAGRSGAALAVSRLAPVFGPIGSATAVAGATISIASRVAGRRARQARADSQAAM